MFNRYAIGNRQSVAVVMLPYPAGDAAIVVSQKMDQKCPLSERSEFRTFPIFCDTTIVLKRSAVTIRAQAGI